MKKIVMMLCMLSLAVPMFAFNWSDYTVEFGKYKCELQQTGTQFYAENIYSCGENAQLKILYYPLGVFDEETEAQYLTPKEYVEQKANDLKEYWFEVKEVDLENDRKIIYAHIDVSRKILLLDGDKILDFGVYHEQYDPANEEEDVKAIQQAEVPAEPVGGF